MKIKRIGNPSDKKIGDAPEFVRWFVKWASKKYGKETPLKEAWFVAEPAVSTPDGLTIGFAAYSPHHQIIISGTGRPLTREDILHNSAHECAHVEQKMLGKPLIERGVNVRARTLLKLWRSSK